MSAAGGGAWAAAQRGPCHDARALEVRRALYAGAESALCMMTIAHAVGQDMELSPWLAEALVDRWLNGQRAALGLSLPLARALHLEIEDLGAMSDLEQLDLEAVRANADLTAEAGSIIMQHGARQPTGTWPPTHGHDGRPHP